MKSFLTPQQIVECKEAAKDLDPWLEDLFVCEPERLPLTRTPIPAEDILFKGKTPEQRAQLDAETVCSQICGDIPGPSATQEALATIRERERLNSRDENIDTVCKALATYVLNKLFSRGEDPTPVPEGQRSGDGVRLLLKAAAELGETGPMVNFMRAFEVNDREGMRASAREIVRGERKSRGGDHA